MKAKVVLVARVKGAGGKFPRVPVQAARQRIVFPIASKYAQDDVIGFYCRHTVAGKRLMESLGKDPNGAYTRYLQIEQDFARVAEGKLPINEPPKSAQSDADRSLAACATEFKGNAVTLGKAKATVAAYSRAVDDLVSQFPNRSIDSIAKSDMLSHIALLRKKVQKRSVGDFQHTLRNRLRFLNVFFHAFNVNPPLAMREIGKPMRSRPQRFSEEVLKNMLAVSTENERDLIQFFLQTGFRDEETAYSKYSDIDFVRGTINVHAKPEFNWSPKDHEARTQDIVLTDAFLNRMKSRMERHGEKSDDLIFPARLSVKPDMHLIRYTQAVAKRAGIEGRVTQHHYRRTFGSLVAKQYGLEQARIWLGHADLETTARYIAAEELNTSEYRQKAKEMFQAYGD
jgi:integrase